MFLNPTGMATSNPDSIIRSSVFILLASTFVRWNEILNSTVATITIDDQREIGAATGAAGSARSFISTICSTLVPLRSFLPIC